MNIRKYALVYSLMLPLLGSTAMLSTSAMARPAIVQPEIDSLYITPDNQSGPGTELGFTLEGTPRGNASVRISGIPRNIPLREVRPGVYEGSYTITRSDRIPPNAKVNGSLKVRNLSAAVSQPLSANLAAVQQPERAVAAPRALVIDRFDVSQIERIEPGTDLRFTVAGAPGAKASFTIDGVVRDVPMQEVRSGVYEGVYTIRRADRFPANVNITAALESNGRAVRSKLAESLVSDARPPIVRHAVPRDGETVFGNPVQISARFDDAGGAGVDPKSVQIIVGGTDVTRGVAITPQNFSYRAELRPGTYPVEVNARDLAGNSVRSNWTFTVAAGPATLPLSITSHDNNASVGRGVTEIRGRTAPDATLDVQVNAVASLAGFVGVNQPVFSQTLRADRNGNFAFNFQPRIPVPGARYEVTINARQDDLSKETKLVLFQEQ